jgi:hypothetical protein
MHTATPQNKKAIAKTLQDNSKEFLSTLEAMEYLTISRSGIFNLLQQKKINQYSLNGLCKRKFYKRSELNQLFTIVA